MGVLLLRPKEHRELLTIAEGNALMRKAFEEFAASRIRLHNPRNRLNLANGLRMTVHQGITPSLRGACTSIHCEFLSEGIVQHYPGRGTPVSALYDTDNARLLMVMLGEARPANFIYAEALQSFPTACAAAVGTDIVARQGASHVGILGSGGQARMHLAALAALRSIDEVLVYSPTPANRERFAKELGDALGLSVKAVASAEAVVKESELILACTNSNKPVLEGGWLQPGSHITSIVHSNKELLEAGLVSAMRQEVDDDTLRRAGIVVTTSKKQEEFDKGAVPFGAAQRGVMSWDDVIEIADILEGRSQLDSVHSRNGITFFHNPAGCGIGMGAFYRGFYDKALEQGVGLDLAEIEGLELVY